MRILPCLLLLALAACATAPRPSDARSDPVFDPVSDAPEPRAATRSPPQQGPRSYAEALAAWNGPEQVNAWIGARFDYDPDRALALSETQRALKPTPAIHPPEHFFDAPKGVCVDLARFAVETLRAIAPGLRVSYLMLEFDPATLRGNVLRRHWLATFEKDGEHYFFADSKRPGHLAGPYPSTRAFVAEYADYRQRRVVGFRELDSFARQERRRSVKVPRAG